MKFTALLILSLSSLTTASLSAVPIIESIAPKSKICPMGNKECRTATQAAPFIISAFQTHKIYAPAEIAAVLALMAFESGDFQYKRNHFPGRPGQGTANMQMPNYNLMYAKSIPEVAKGFQGIESTQGMSDAELNDLLDQVTVDKYNFGSGPWFLATQCKDDVRQAFKQDADAGFKAYIEECVGTEVAPRQEYFNRAKKAFGL
ncbi:hypothetical protein F53441_4002 [Fusarium austroafricanum]|uniref:Uncharacterized protein n=1 Tax=Fusarium austroafricanum TaxID=2364996 RepID=A0A8H4P9Y0_9HYPO|nr:hypothetical protein F53441_4002 [Fusarium austroafricanum]